MTRFLYTLIVTFALTSNALAGVCSTKVASLTSDKKKAPVENITAPARDLRFALPFKRIADAMNSSFDPNVIIENLIDENLRLEVFTLESDGRDYEKSTLLTKEERQAFGKFNGKMQRLEDMLGDYADAKNYLKTAKELRDGGYPGLDDVIIWLENNKATLHQNFFELLSDDGWLATNPRYLASYAKVEKIFSNLNARADNNQRLREIADALEKDASKTFDINSLENGIHPLRRHLRWFMLKARSTNGLIQIKENARGSSWTVPNINKEHTAKYANLPVVGLQKQVAWIDRPLYQSIVNMVEVLGLAKDTGQFTENYTKAYMETNTRLSQEQATALATKLVAARPKDETVDPASAADNVQKYLKSHKTREKIAKQLRAAIR